MQLARERVALEASSGLFLGELSVWLVPKDDEFALAGAGYVGESWPTKVMKHSSGADWGGFFVADGEVPPGGDAVWRFMDPSSPDYPVVLGEGSPGQWGDGTHTIIPVRGVGAAPSFLTEAHPSTAQGGSNEWENARRDLAVVGSTRLVRDAARAERIRTLADEILDEIASLEALPGTTDRAVVDLLVREQVTRIAAVADESVTSITQLREVLDDMADAGARLEAGRSVVRQAWGLADVAGRISALLTLVNAVLALFGLPEIRIL